MSVAHATAVSQRSLRNMLARCWEEAGKTHLTRSARVSGCNGKLAKCEMSLSVTVFVCNFLSWLPLANSALLVLLTVRGQHSRMNCDWIISGR
jgi:hypothetical protein